MTTPILVNGLTRPEYFEILTKAIKQYGKDTVSNGVDTLNINDYVSTTINSFSNLRDNEKNLKNTLFNIDFYVNVEEGNLIYLGNGRYTQYETRDNVFSKIFNKLTRDFIKKVKPVDEELITLKNAAKTILKELLAQCTEGQQMMFKRMYSHNNLELPINDVVDQMSEDKIDWAISQCERTVEKNSKII